MIKVLVLEDNESSLNGLTGILQKSSENLQVFGVRSKEEAIKLLDDEACFDLFMLDINLNDKDVEDEGGMEFAREVRKRHPYVFTPIIFITSIMSMELSSYREIHCYGYVTKPFDEMEIEKMVQQVLNHAEEKEEFVIVKKDGVNYKIFCKDIVYIQAVPRGVEFILKEETMEVKYLTIKQLLPKLPKEDFFQCHRMYVINRKHMEYADVVNQVIKMQGRREMVELGITYKTQMRSWLNE